MLRVKDFAKKYKLSTKQVRDMFHSGKLAGKQVSKKSAIFIDENAFLNKKEEQKPSQFANISEVYGFVLNTIQKRINENVNEKYSVEYIRSLVDLIKIGLEHDLLNNTVEEVGSGTEQISDSDKSYANYIVDSYFKAKNNKLQEQD